MASMARRRPRRTNQPQPPECPEEYAAAPTGVSDGAVWDCVEADGRTAVDSRVTDWKVQECRLTGLDLAGRTVETFRCRDTHFVRCDLSSAVLDGAHLERVVFTECRLTGTVLSRAQLGDVRIRECTADMLDLRESRGFRLLVEDTQLRAADLTEFEMVDGAIVRSNLSRAILHDARLRRVRLHGSDLSGVRNPLALGGCVIGSEQQVVVGALVLGALDITITDDEDGP